MARIDGVKEEIGRLKVIHGLSIVSYISLLGWMVQNYIIEQNFSNHPGWLPWGAFVVLVSISLMTISTDIQIRKKIKELDGL